MLRLSRSRVINDIEFLIDEASPTTGRQSWTANGAGCSVDRLSFANEAYNFYVRILQVRVPATGRANWKVFIVSQSWQDSEGKDIYSTKWLKLVSGKPGDVLKWISANAAAPRERVKDV